MIWILTLLGNICTLAKLENNYLVEFIEHYRKYGIDKIFIYDNNDINGENLNILSNYSDSKLIEIFNYRGQVYPQKKAYYNCYYKNKKKYKWFLFYDIDEFLYLKDYSDIHNFLAQTKFKKCQAIYLNFVTHTDNDLFYYNNRSLFQRFPRSFNKNNRCIGKSILNDNIENLNITSVHLIDSKIKRCNGFGNLISINSIFCKITDYKNNYIDHFPFKSTEEFVNKINKGDGCFINNNKNKYRKIWQYFSLNKITLKKINYIANKTGLNASFIQKELFLNYTKFKWK